MHARPKAPTLKLEQETDLSFMYHIENLK